MKSADSFEACSLFADKVFLNGRVITVDADNSIAAAVAIRGDKIVAVGETEKIKNFVGPNTQLFDLKQKALLPGFIDAHCHMLAFGLNLGQVDCSYPAVRSIEDILESISQKTRCIPKGQWIRGWGWDEFALKEGRPPNRFELDKAAPNHPVILNRTCIHASAANSMALKKAGIDGQTENPYGGEIERDAKGRPTGLLREMPAMDLIESVIDLPEIPDLREALKQADKVFLREGITSIHDAGVGSVNRADVRAYQEAVTQDNIQVRIYMTLREYTYRKLAYQDDGLGVYTGFGDNRLRIGPVKLLIDGGIGARTAAMRESYENEPDEKGFLTIPRSQLVHRMRKAHENKFQLAVHAIGDLAIETTLDCYEEILNSIPRENHRHRIEHFACAAPDLVSRARKLNIQPVIQPTFLYRLGESFAKNLGKRIQFVIPCNSLIQAGLRPAGSSDRPVVPGNPLLGIYAAVTRKTDANTVLAPDEKISVMDAIRLFTINGAYVSFEEDIKGSIEPGKLADLIILNQDPLSVDPDKLKDLEVQLTMINGKVAFKSDKL